MVPPDGFTVGISPGTGTEGDHRPTTFPEESAYRRVWAAKRGAGRTGGCTQIVRLCAAPARPRGRLGSCTKASSGRIARRVGGDRGLPAVGSITRPRQPRDGRAGGPSAIIELVRHYRQEG